MSDLMNTAANEVIRREILELCRQTAPYGAGMQILRAALKKCVNGLPEKELMVHVDYLAGKKLVRKDIVENKRLNIRRCIVSLTPEGIDYLEGNGPDITGVD